MLIFSIVCWSVSNEINWSQRHHWKCTANERGCREFNKECRKCSVSNYYVMCTTFPSFKLFSLLKSCYFAPTHTFVTFIAQSQIIYELKNKTDAQNVGLSQKKTKLANWSKRIDCAASFHFESDVKPKVCNGNWNITKCRLQTDVLRVHYFFSRIDVCSMQWDCQPFVLHLFRY